MQKWEYLVLRSTKHKLIVNRGLNPVEISPLSIPEALATFGDEGWQLVGITRIEAEPDLIHYEAFTQYTFKRPLPIQIEMKS